MMTIPNPSHNFARTPPMSPDLKDYMTTEEAAKLLGFNVKSVQNMLRNGKLEGIKISGKAWLISRKSIAAYQRETQGMAKNDPRRSQS